MSSSPAVLKDIPLSTEVGSAETTPSAVASRSVNLDTVEFCFEACEFGVCLDGSLSQEAKALLPDTAFNEFNFVFDKVRHGVPLQTIHEDLVAFSKNIRNEIDLQLADELEPAMTDILKRAVELKAELEETRKPLKRTMKELTEACETLKGLEEGITQKLEAMSVLSSRQLFDTALLKSLFLYENIVKLVHSLNAKVMEKEPNVNRGAEGVQQYNNKGGQSTLSSSRELLNDEDALATLDYCIAYWPQRLEAIQSLVLAVTTLRQAVAIVEAFNAAAESDEDAKRKEEQKEMISLKHQVEDVVFTMLEIFFSEVAHFFFICNESEERHAKCCAEVCLNLLQDVPSLYHMLGEYSRFTAAAQSAVVIPLLQRVMSWTATSQTRLSVDDTVKLLRRLQQVLCGGLAPLLPQWRRRRQGDAVFPVVDVVWPSIHKVLEIKMAKSLFDAGVPKDFHKKYMAAHELEGTLANLCESEEEKRRFFACSTLNDWKGKWQLGLDIYISECTRREVLVVEKCVDEWKNLLTSPSSSSPTAITGSPSRTSPTASAPQSSPTTANNEQELFSRKCTQLLEAYKKMATHLFSEACLAAALPPFLRHTVSTSRNIAIAMLRASMDVVQRTDAEASANNSDTQERTCTRALMFALSALDLTKVVSEYVEGPFLELVKKAAVSSSAGEESVPPGDVVGSIFTVCQFCKTALVTGEFMELLNCLEEYVVRECTQSVQNIKSVRSVYSHTNRDLPTAASWYVAAIVQPLRALSQANATLQPCRHRGVGLMLGSSGPASRCESELTAQYRSIFETISSRILTEFINLSKETLVAAKKADEGWEKLRRKREAAAQSASPPAELTEERAVGSPAGAAAGRRVTTETATDRDKMVLQLYLDAKELLRLMRAVAPPGVVLDESHETVRDLLSVLRRGEWIAGANIPEPLDTDF